MYVDELCFEVVISGGFRVGGPEARLKWRAL